jgi:hypothetical protein
MKYIKYLKYVVKHKWFVAVECFKVGLYWRGLTHDWHKFLPSEWFPYTEFFYGKKAKPVRDNTGYYKPTDTGDTSFDFAWLLHQKRADHHYQWWLLPEDDGGMKILPMSPKARLEMTCDWCGASKAQGHGGWSGVKTWYEKNKHKMRFAPETKDWIESCLMNHDHD